jgi:hypothetical protein
MGAVAVLIPLPILRRVSYRCSICCTRVGAHSPSDGPTDEHVSETERTCLECCADGHNHCADQNRLFTAEFITHPESSDGTEEAADVVDSSDGGKLASTARSNKIV